MWAHFMRKPAATPGQTRRREARWPESLFSSNWGKARTESHHMVTRINLAPLDVAIPYDRGHVPDSDDSELLLFEVYTGSALSPLEREKVFNMPRRESPTSDSSVASMIPSCDVVFRTKSNPSQRRRRTESRPDLVTRCSIMRWVSVHVAKAYGWPEMPTHETRREWYVAFAKPDHDRTDPFEGSHRPAFLTSVLCHPAYLWRCVLCLQPSDSESDAWIHGFEVHSFSP